MPNFNFGDNLSFDRKDLFLELKTKDQRFHIRFVGGGNYDGKHFMQGDDGKWLISYCPRIMEEAHCEYCQLFFEAQKLLKETDESEKTKLKELEKEVRKYKAKITFYYPVINRETEKAQILKTSLSVRLALEEELKNDIDITQFDYYLTRTEKPGSEYYKLTRIDSSKTTSLSEEEEKALKIAKGLTLKVLCMVVKAQWTLRQSKKLLLTTFLIKRKCLASLTRLLTKMSTLMTFRSSCAE